MRITLGIIACLLLAVTFANAGNKRPKCPDKEWAGALMACRRVASRVHFAAAPWQSFLSSRTRRRF
jgi:hypothetical protein